MMPILTTFRPLGHHFGSIFAFCFVTLWRFLFGHAFQHVLKLNLACFLKDLGDYFDTLLEVLASSSGNDETLEFDDCFMKFYVFLMLTTIIFQEKLEEKSIQRGRRAHPRHPTDFI